MTDSFATTITKAMNATFGAPWSGSALPSLGSGFSWRTHYSALRAFASSNSPYDDLAGEFSLRGVAAPNIKAFRNPTSAVIGYYVSTLWPGRLEDALPVEPARDDQNAALLVEAILRVWDWGNLNEQKDVLAFWLPELGDVFGRVSTRTGTAGRTTRVFPELIEPDHVTDFEKDERDYLTYIRLDVPRAEHVWHTEVWSKAEGLYRAWVSDRGPEQPLAEMGAPVDERPLSDWGIDFVPFVHFKFINDGRPRGLAAIMPALDKIIEADQMATRLHEMLFVYNKPDWSLESTAAGRDVTGDTAPPFVDSQGNAVDAGEIRLSGERIWQIPPGYTLRTLIPNVNFDSHLRALESHLAYLQETDLPELGYYRIGGNSADLSGRAIRYKLIPAIARTQRVRGSAEAKLVQLTQMALTIAANARLAGFTNLGSWENGDFDFTIPDRPVIPDDPAEEAQSKLQFAQAGVLLKQLGWSNEQLQRDLGLSEEEITAMATENASAGLAATQAFNAGSTAATPPATSPDVATSMLNAARAAMNGNG